MSARTALLLGMTPQPRIFDEDYLPAAPAPSPAPKPRAPRRARIQNLAPQGPITVGKELSARQKKFIDLYCSGHSPRMAALGAGYAPKSARTHGYHLLKQNTLVAAAVARRLGKGPDAPPVYTAKEASAEIDELIEFAKQTNNPNAYAQGIRLRMALHGLGEPDRAVLAGGFTLHVFGLAMPTAGSAYPTRPAEGNTPSTYERPPQ